MSSMILQMLYIMKWRDCFDTHWLDCCASLCSDLFKPSFDKNIFEHLECELSIEYLLDILSVLSISQCRYIRILIWDYFLYHTMMLWMVKFLHNFERELGGELLWISNISPAHILWEAVTVSRKYYPKQYGDSGWKRNVHKPRTKHK